MFHEDARAPPILSKVGTRLITIELRILQYFKHLQIKFHRFLIKFQLILHREEAHLLHHLDDVVGVVVHPPDLEEYAEGVLVTW